VQAYEGSSGHGSVFGAHLSRRELQVLELMAQGETNAEVAAALEISIHAVKFHLASVFRKLGVHNRTEAASVYLRASPETPSG
jgi:DNA-binding CsgD family transcriptional regulator